MAKQLKVPTLGMDMEEATVLKWLVEEGDEVSKGDPVLEIETDKTSFEIEANDDGTIKNLRGEEGQTLPVGTVLAYITDPGEEAPEHEEFLEAEEEEEEEGEPRSGDAEETPGSEAAQAPDERPEAPETNGDRGQVRASPAARQAAAEQELSIENVSGSGPHGRVYLSDVLEADGQERVSEEAVGEDVAVPEPFRKEPLSRVRQIAGERTARSFAEVPHFYLRRNLEVDRLLELLERLGEKMDPAPTVTDLLGLAVARTLKYHPRLNASYVGDELELRESVNLGMAVATDRGLLVPVLRGADGLSLRELVSKSRELVRQTREGNISSDGLSGGTFTISNLGMMGIDSFDAIINAPEAAILAVGRVQTVPEWSGGEWLPRRIISMTLSVDHRVADGADGSRFLGDLQNALTDWELLL